MTDENHTTKADLRELRKEINEDIKQYMGVQYEKFHSDVQFLAKQISSLIQRVERLEQKMEQLEQRVGRLEQRMDIILDAVGTMHVELTEIKGQLNQKIDLPEYVILEKRVSQLEATV